MLNHLTPKGSFMVLKSSGNISSINIQLFYIREKCKTTGRMRVTCVLASERGSLTLLRQRGTHPIVSRFAGRKWRSKR